MPTYSHQKTTLCTRFGTIERYELSVPRIRWGDYFERRRFLGVIPYDVPKMTKPDEYRAFLRFAIRFFFRVAGQLPVYFCLARTTCDALTIEHVQRYCRDEGAVLKQHERCFYVMFTDPLAAEAFLLSGALEKRRAVEAFSPHQEDVVQCNAKNWHVKEWERIVCYMRCYLDKPIAVIGVHSKDAPRVDSLLEECRGHAPSQHRQESGVG